MMMSKFKSRIKTKTTLLGLELMVRISDAKIDIELVLKWTAIAVGNDTAKRFHIYWSQCKINTLDDYAVSAITGELEVISKHTKHKTKVMTLGNQPTVS